MPCHGTATEASGSGSIALTAVAAQTDERASADRVGGMPIIWIGESPWPTIVVWQWIG